MPNAYVILAVSKDANVVYVSATVNGVGPVSIAVPLATWNSFPNVTSQVDYIAPLLVAAAFPTTVIPGVAGTYNI